jgi:DNA topoisomerase-1
MKTKKKAIPFIGGNAKGHFSNKWNRAAKLNNMFPELEVKLQGILERGYQKKSESYRCAVACLMMMHTGVRVGNERSAEGYISKRKDALGREIQTYGLTTLKPKHVRAGKLRFIGKREVAQLITIPALLRKDVERLASDKGETVFNLSLYQLSKFVKTYVGRNFSPKDFRTVVGCRIASEEVAQLRPWSTKSEMKKQVRTVCEKVALQLGNTAAIAKKAYINPEILSL